MHRKQIISQQKKHHELCMMGFSLPGRLVPIRESGWKNFDVTQAVHYWLRNKRQEPMVLQVWIEGEMVGSYAAEVAKAVRFTSQDAGDRAVGRPELVLYTLDLEDYG